MSNDKPQPRPDPNDEYDSNKNNILRPSDVGTAELKEKK